MSSPDLPASIAATIAAWEDHADLRVREIIAGPGAWVITYRDRAEVCTVTGADSAPWSSLAADLRSLLLSASAGDLYIARAASGDLLIWWSVSPGIGADRPVYPHHARIPLCSA